MTRDELEAAIWHHLTAMACHRITQDAFVDAILAAADAYAAGDSEHVTRIRRAVLARTPQPGVAELQAEAARRAGLRAYPATAIRRQEQADIPRRGRKNPP